MLTYRELFAVREFRVLFLNRCAVMVSVAASGLALGTVMYEATGSALLTGLSMFGGPLVSLVTSQFLLATSDLVRPRTALLLQMLAALVADAPQMIPGLPWQARFALLAVPYVVNSMFSGTQWAIVREIVPAESFVLARSALNLAVGAMQIVGYAVGGVALLWLTPTQLFLVAALADLVCLVNIAAGIGDRPARSRGDGGRAGVVRRTRAVNRHLLGSPVTRPLYLAMWVPNGLVVGCEALFVPYAHSAAGQGLGHGSAAGWLFASAAAGMMLGDLTVGRYATAGLRDRLIEPLRLLLAVPYLALLFSPPPALVVPLAFVASVGYGASLPLQDRLLRHTQDEHTGQAMGLYSQGMMVWQALGAGIAGALANEMSPSHAMGLMAVGSLAVTLLLVRGLRHSRTVLDLRAT
ncbi:MFS transporter [Nocardioides sp.]|uniref:MFS transporter n=1 Tax=Nocardioides sp. TaxID=35761 RepID=UPI002CEF5E75|nr:MFS transporter [Nocardioides sp.]HVX55230.1 MFS transporter [Nocardioides sp.]